MPYASKLTERGQTTLPSAVRELLGAKSGDTLEYEITEEGVLLRVRRPALEDVLARFAGKYGSGVVHTPQETLERSRAERGWDEADADLFETWAGERQP